jgi:hypothetical protein
VRFVSTGRPRGPIGALRHFETVKITPEPGKTSGDTVPGNIESQTRRSTGPHPTGGRDNGSANLRFTSGFVLYCKLRRQLNKVVLPHSNSISATALASRRTWSKLLRPSVGIFLRLLFFNYSRTEAVRAQRAAIWTRACEP